MNRWLSWSACLLVACSNAPVGGERQACGPMGECFSGLTCLSGVCVRAASGGGGAEAGGSAGGASAGGASGGSAGGASGGGAADAGVCVPAQCGPGEGCELGACRFGLTGFTLSVSDAGVFVAPAVLPVRATPTLRSGVASVNLPANIQFELGALDMGTLTLQGSEYRGDVILPATTTSGAYRLTVSYRRGAESASESQTLRVLGGPPVLSVQWPEPVPRDAVAAGWLVSDRPLDTAGLRVGASVATAVPDAACAPVACPPQRFCRCLELDFSLLDVPGLTVDLPATLTGRDRSGNEQLDGGATIAATRLRWVVNPRTSPGTRGMAPALDRAGSLYTMGSDSTGVHVAVLNPDGGTRSTLSSDGLVPVAAVGDVGANEVFFLATSTATQTTIRGVLTSTLTSAGTVTQSRGGTLQQPAFVSAQSGVPSQFVVAVSNGTDGRVIGTNLTTTTVTTDRADLAVTPSPRSNVPLNLAARGDVIAIAYADTGSQFDYALVDFSPPPIPNLPPVTVSSPGWSAPGPVLGLALRGAPMVTDPFGAVVSAAFLFGEYGSPGPRNLAVTNPGHLAVDEQRRLVFGLGNSLVRLDATWETASPLVLHTSTSPIVHTPVLGEPVGTAEPEAYAVTEAGDVIVVRGATFRYSMRLPVTGRPMPLSLDCNRQRPGSRTGVLYVTFESGPVVAVVVDAPKLRVGARWPKFQRTAGNRADLLEPELNPGCP